MLGGKETRDLNVNGRGLHLSWWWGLSVMRGVQGECTMYGLYPDPRRMQDQASTKSSSVTSGI